MMIFSANFTFANFPYAKKQKTKMQKIRSPRKNMILQ